MGGNTSGIEGAGTEYDLAIVGSGGAGFAAAIAASTQGARVVMVEQGTTGGTCVNTGCVPSKALLAAAGARYSAATQAFPGIATSAGPVDVAALIAGKTALVEQLRAEKYTDLATDYGWPILHGTARFADTGDGPVLQVELTDGDQRQVRAAHYLIATGSAMAVRPSAHSHDPDPDRAGATAARKRAGVLPP